LRKCRSNGHLLVGNSDGINPDANQPSEIVEFTVDGKFIGQLSINPAQGGAFGLNTVKVTDDVVRFAAVDDNANTITIWHAATHRYISVELLDRRKNISKTITGNGEQRAAWRPRTCAV
jgi:hypothetical protein